MRNSKNGKILRAVSIGLAAMVTVTSTPITSFAASLGTQDATSENLQSLIGDITAKDATGENPGVSQSIDNAQTTIDGLPSLDAQDDLKNAGNAVDDKNDEKNKSTKDYLEDLKKDLETNSAAEAQAKKDAEAIETKVDSVLVAELVPAVDEDGNPVADEDGNLQYQVVFKGAFADGATKAENNLNGIADNARKANSSSDEGEARAAATNATEALKNASDGLDQADKAVNAAEEGFDTAWDDLNKAQKAFDESSVELEELEKTLGGAQDESKAAHDAAEAAKEKVEALEADSAELALISDLYDNYNKACEDQKTKSNAYHSKYDKLSNSVKNKYNDWRSGKTADLSDEEKELFEEVKKLQIEANGAYTDIWTEAGNLTKALVKYYVSREDGYAGNFQVSGGIDGEGYEDLSKDLLWYTFTVGDKYTETVDENGDPVYTRIDTTYNFPEVMLDDNGNIIYKNGNPAYKWVGTGELNKGYSFRTDTGWVLSPNADGVSQPNNVVVVRYQTKENELDENGNILCDENGNEIYSLKDVERYYNCKIVGGEVIFFERNIEVVDGEKVGDITLQKLQYSTDDYKEIDDVKDASVVKKYLEAREDLNAAKKAVDIAEAKTRKLMEDIAKLKVSAPTSKELEELSMKLEISQSLLNDAKDKKDELQKAYDEAKKAVAGIDLSRFDHSSSSDDDDDDQDDAGLAPIGGNAGNDAAAVNGRANGGNNNGGVNNAGTDNGNDGNGAADDAGNADANDNGNAQNGGNQQYTEIEDGSVALANGPVSAGNAEEAGKLNAIFYFGLSGAILL